MIVRASVRTGGEEEDNGGGGLRVVASGGRLLGRLGSRCSSKDGVTTVSVRRGGQRRTSGFYSHSGLVGVEEKEKGFSHGQRPRRRGQDGLAPPASAFSVRRGRGQRWGRWLPGSEGKEEKGAVKGRPRASVSGQYLAATLEERLHVLASSGGPG
uniref:Uncharacterized protein n=1 Tax=Oryza meyeriana var. granulata TaxID=110450 RepID=A0A1V1H6S0_9ORYZ|nr:hypothetical protein [Oryza meyeriana var. granulata]